MRRMVMTVALALCGVEAPLAQTQPQSEGGALETCLRAAGDSRAALVRCKGAIAEPCIEAPGGETTAGMVQCYGAEAEAWLVQLAAAVERARADAERATYLAQAEAAWRGWVQAECRYQASLYQGGSLARVLAASCTADLTAERTIAFLAAERSVDE